MRDQGYTHPTPVQEQAIPAILAGRDLMAAAQTGTGKTAAFALPLLQRLSAGQPSQSRAVRALVVVPTRELAMQVDSFVRTYGSGLRLRSTAVYGGVGMQPQIAALKRGIDVLVATPGRLLDHTSRRTVDLSRVEVLVLDEADRMLDMGFIRDINRILDLLPPSRQNLLFSATFPREIEALAQGLLRSPERIQVARANSTAETVEQLVYRVSKEGKTGALARLIEDGAWEQVLVFTRTKHGADRLAHKLDRRGLRATAIHGNKSQGARTRALAEFKAGKVRVLVATEIAARGLDIDGLPRVVNFELPYVPEDYVHRIGRTGRAGASGQAVSLVSHDETGLLADIERLVGRRIGVGTLDGVDAGPPPAAAAPRPALRKQAPRRPAPRSGGGEARGAGKPTSAPTGSSGARPGAPGRRSFGGRWGGRGRSGQRAGYAGR